MNKEKQIEEMAKAIEQARIKATDTTNSMNYGFGGWYAKELYNAGYRKASEVTLEVIDEALKIAKEIADNCGELAVLEENAIKRIEAKGEQIGALLVLEAVAELKKKYMEGER